MQLKEAKLCQSWHRVYKSAHFCSSIWRMHNHCVRQKCWPVLVKFAENKEKQLRNKDNEPLDTNNGSWKAPLSVVSINLEPFDAHRITTNVAPILPQWYHSISPIPSHLLMQKTVNSDEIFLHSLHAWTWSRCPSYGRIVSQDLVRPRCCSRVVNELNNSWKK